MTTNSQLRHFRITSKKILVVKLGKYHYESKPKVHLVLLVVTREGKITTLMTDETELRNYYMHSCFA